MRKNLKQWILRDTSNSYLFVLLFLILIAKTFLPIGIITTLPVYTGLNGISISNETMMNLSKSLSNQFTETGIYLNHFGYEHKDNLILKAVAAFYVVSPYIIIFGFFILTLEIIRIAISTIYKKYIKRSKCVKILNR